jgi:hypothetical protein
MKKILSILVLVTICFAQQDSTQIQFDRFIKETEAITGSITKQIVQKDLTIQQLLNSNVQLGKELQKIQQELNGLKKEASKSKK